MRLGGTESHIRELATRLGTVGHDVSLLTLQGKQTVRFDRVRVFTVKPSRGESLDSYPNGNPMLYLYTSLYALKALVALLSMRARGAKFDVVSVHFTVEAALCIILRPLMRWKVMFVLEGFTSAEARTARFSDATVAISQTIAQKCASRFGFSPTVIPAGVDRSRFRPSSQARKREVLIVGRMVDVKGLEMLAPIAQSLERLTKDFQFVVVGDGPLRVVTESGVRQQGLEGHFSFPGRVDDDQLVEYYQESSVFLYAGAIREEDSFSIAVLEANSCGLPAIVLSEEAKFEALGDGGVVIKPDKTSKIAEEIERMLVDDVYWKKISRKAIENAESHDWTRIMVAYDHAYRRCADLP